MNAADRLRRLAEHLPPGGSLTLTRAGLLELAGVDSSQSAEEAGTGDFTVAQLATRFHRSASTIRDWCEHGRFEGAYKLNGRDWRIPEAGVGAFLSEQRSGRSVAQLGAWREARRAGVVGRR